MFRFYSYRVPHLEEKEGPFFDTFLTLIAVLRSATVVKMATKHRFPPRSRLLPVLHPDCYGMNTISVVWIGM